jgi:hypothetical protein
MPGKIAAFLITLIVNIGAGAILLFVMLLTMNGYSESDAIWGLGAYVVLALTAALIVSLASVLLTGRLVKRQFSTAVSLLISIPVFSVVGIALELICSFMGVGVAEFVRVKF